MLSSALGLAVAMTPLASIAGMGAEENINIYGWQNWSYEFIDAEDGREYDRLSNNAANIGFMSHMETGIDGLQVGLRCEQFTYWGRNNVYTDWCNRNSKISLRHETLGEIMFAQWLLPYNEIVAAWIDPFYDAGADSHTSIMGNIGGNGTNAGGAVTALFYNGSFDDEWDSGFGDGYGALSFNRRQEGVIQYVWPNTSAMASQARDGFQFRFALTEGSNTDSDRGGATLDPRIYSTGISYQKNLVNGGHAWFAVAYEKHEDLSITDLANPSGDSFGLADNDFVQGDSATVAASCDESDDDAIRIAGRYTHDWGNGMKTQLGAMWEDLDYDADDCTAFNEGATAGYGNDATGEVQAVWTDVERDAWMISGKHTFGNGFDFRFSYMDADEWDCGDDSACTSVQEDDTDANAYNVGLFYTMPAGTELRLTYSEVQNEDNAGYDFGINGFSGASQGGDVEMLAVGIVHWFD